MLYENYFDEINAELKELAARQAAEEVEASTNNRIFIGSGEDGDHASQYFKTIHVVI